MELSSRYRGLEDLYAEFEAGAAPWRAAALCRPGCASCCTHYGRLKIVTLEALRIHAWLENQDRSARAASTLSAP
jgi:hypothetical protein